MEKLVDRSLTAAMVLIDITMRFRSVRPEVVGSGSSARTSAPRLESHEGDREHETDRQRAARRRPYAARRAGLRRRDPGRTCAHQSEGRTSTAVDVKHERVSADQRLVKFRTKRFRGNVA